MKLSNAFCHFLILLVLFMHHGKCYATDTENTSDGDGVAQQKEFDMEDVFRHLTNKRRILKFMQVQRHGNRAP